MGRIGWNLPGTKSTKARKRLKNLCARLQKERGGGGGAFGCNWSIHVGHQMTSLYLDTPFDSHVDDEMYRSAAWHVVMAIGKELIAPND